MRKIGFTGTQDGMTWKQGSRLEQAMKELTADTWRNEFEFHHGVCIGADEEAHWLAYAVGMDLVLHPPLDSSKMSTSLGDLLNYRVEPAQDYIRRNHDIVDATDELWATPGGMNEVLRSGTWATIRYALKVGRVVTIFWPDGTVTKEPA